jgi:hypothetical protein
LSHNWSTNRPATDLRATKMLVDLLKNAEKKASRRRRAG